MNTKSIRIWLREGLAKWRDASLQSQITRASLLLSTVNLLACLVFAFLLVRHFALETLQSSATSELELRATRLEAALNQRVRELTELTRNPLVTNAIADTDGRRAYLAPYMTEVERSAHGYSRLTLIDLQGNTLAGTVAEEIAPAWLTPALVASLEAGHKHAFIADGDDSVLMVVVPVLFPPTKTVEGVLYGSIRLQPLLAESGLGRASDKSVALLSGDARELVRIDIFPGDGTAATYSRNLDLLAPISRMGMNMQLVVSDFEAVALNGVLGIAFFGAGGVAFFLTLLVSWRVARGISRPVLQLSAAAADIARFGSVSQVEIPRVGYGEVAGLADSLRLMADAVRRHQAQLEENVRSRTRDLADAKQQLDDVLSNVDDAIWSYGIAERRFRVVSEAAARMTGIPADRLLNNRNLWRQCVVLADRLKIKRAVQSLMQLRADVIEVDCRIVTAAGDRRVLRTRLRAVMDERHRMVRVDGISTDITLKVAVEDRLRLLERGLNSSSNGIIITDWRTADNPVMYVNPAFERITGYSALEVIGRNCRFLHRDDMEQPGLDELRMTVREGKSCRVLLINSRKNGEKFWNELSISPVFTSSGEVSHFVGVSNDVTAQKRSESEQLLHMGRLESILSLSPDGFATFDGNRRLTFANEALQRVADLGIAELHGLTLDEVWEKLRARADSRYSFPDMGACSGADSASTEDDRRDLRRALMHLENGKKPRVMQVAIRDGMTSHATYIMFLRDMTREAEVDRMKSEFLSTAAHELRTPMASILGFSELLITRELPAEIRIDLYRTINDQANRLSNLLNELLDLARIEARMGRDFKYASTSVADVVQSTINGLMFPGDDRKLEIEMPDGNLLVRVDPEKIQQALTNVISNAYKYSPAGGTIGLRVEASDGHVRISIRDRGIGMTAEQLSHAFERFYRADNTGNIPGTGLGLSLVKEIVEIHGGNCTISSELGVGTEVVIDLPLVLESTAIAA